MGISARFLVHISIAEIRTYPENKYPCFRSLNLSTKTSKSMALGESKSYSFLKALADCSGVKGR